MPKGTAICYLFSLIFYVMGYSKTRGINNAFTDQLTTHDVTIYVTLATVYFVLAIFFAVIGSLVFYVNYSQDQKAMKTKGQLKVDRQLDRRRRESKVQFKKPKQPKHSIDLYRRIS